MCDTTGELDICAFFEEVLSASGPIDDEITHDASYADGMICEASYLPETNNEQGKFRVKIGNIKSCSPANTVVVVVGSYLCGRYRANYCYNGRIASMRPNSSPVNQCLRRALARFMTSCAVLGSLRSCSAVKYSAMMNCSFDRARYAFGMVIEGKRESRKYGIDCSKVRSFVSSNQYWMSLKSRTMPSRQEKDRDYTDHSLRKVSELRIKSQRPGTEGRDSPLGGLGPAAFPCLH